MLQYHILAVIIGCIVDFFLGDPHSFPHPVIAIGKLITWLEGYLRNGFPKGEKGEKQAGVVLVVLVPGITAMVAGGILYLFYRISPWMGVIAESLICYQMMAWRSLRKESMKVYHALKNRDTEGARTAVSMIVGRDTTTLTEEGIIKAAVETVAENASDGVIAPLIYMVLFGGFGVCIYKAVNTMDSMVGYKNEKYMWFGRAAAKLDDVFNYIPARISAVLMIGAGYILSFIANAEERCNYSGKNGAYIFKRDRYNHKSPNSAQTEAVCAGALKIQLAGNAYYFGKLQEKPAIGDNLRPVVYEDIRRANSLMTVTYILALVPVVILLAVLWLV